MKSDRRVAFFTDSFHEVNGVALTSRQFEAFARRHQLPFFSAHAGPETATRSDGSAVVYEIQRGSTAFNLEATSDLSFDPLLWINRQALLDALRSFKPDILHVTGPGDFGMLGAWLAHQLKIPLAASWHTNIHEYAGRRLEKLLSFMPEKQVRVVGAAAERHTLTGAAKFYNLASVLFAPNRELVDMLQARTGKDCYLMQRGVDAVQFSPSKRDPGLRPFTIGYVGRLSIEKNVRLLAEVERTLLSAGQTGFRFLIAGSGGDQDWLAANLSHAEFLGVVRGEELARAYANMDVFAFPSHTDTFGNVILEALASGVPSVVTTGGGPKFLVKSGVTGYVASGDQAFSRCILDLMSDRELHARMSAAAREYACSISWDRVFEQVYDAYEKTVFAQPSMGVAS